MREDLPVNHVEESMKLEARAYIELFHLELVDDQTAINLYFCPQKSITWQGHTWETWTMGISDFTQNTNGTASRPTLSVANPQGLFSRYSHRGTLDNGIVNRYRVLRPDIDANVNSFQRNMWRISKIISMDDVLCTAELRSVLDGQTFFLPPRVYRPPEFPAVSLR